MNKIVKYEKDTQKHIDETSMVQLSRDLLLKVVETTGIMQSTKMTEEGLKQAKLVLNYLNAVNSTIKTRLQFFKMTGLNDKIRRVKARSKVVE